MSLQSNEVMLRYVEAASSLTERLLNQNQNYAQQEKVAADKRAGVIEKMLTVGAIEPHQKAAAEAMLSNPGQALDILCTALDKMAEYKAAAVAANAELGRPVPAPETRSGAPDVQKSAGVSYLGLANQPAPALVSVMNSIMNDPR